MKVGDRVRCVDNHCAEGYLTIGEEYIVHEVKVDDDDDVFINGWYQHRFELLGSCIPISDIPDGWEAVRIGTPKEGDWYYYAGGVRKTLSDHDHLWPAVILRPVTDITEDDIGQLVKYRGKTYTLDGISGKFCYLCDKLCFHKVPKKDVTRG